LGNKAKERSKRKEKIRRGKKRETMGVKIIEGSKN